MQEDPFRDPSLAQPQALSQHQISIATLGRAIYCDKEFSVAKKDRGAVGRLSQHGFSVATGLPPRHARAHSVARGVPVTRVSVHLVVHATACTARLSWVGAHPLHHPVGIQLSCCDTRRPNLNHTLLRHGPRWQHRAQITLFDREDLFRDRSHLASLGTLSRHRARRLCCVRTLCCLSPIPAARSSLSRAPRLGRPPSQQVV